MPYVKGQSGNPGGRPVATQTTREATIEKLEALLCQYLVDNFKMLDNTDTPHDLKRAKFYLELMKFIVPRAPAAKEKELKFENLSTDQLEEIADDLLVKAIPHYSLANRYDIQTDDSKEFVKELAEKLKANGHFPPGGNGSVNRKSQDIFR